MHAMRREGSVEPLLLIKLKYVGLEKRSASLAWFPESGSFCQLVSVELCQPHYRSLCIPGKFSLSGTLSTLY